MNDTRNQLLRASRRLFARRGFAGASIRAITRQAGANLGAVTYHFQSKQRLYHEVLATVTQPLAQRIQAAAGLDGPALARIENILRALFEHLARHPEMPGLMLHELTLTRPVPEPVRAAMGQVFGALAMCIEAGQRDGSIVAGNPKHLALGIVAQPLYSALAQRPLREVLGLGLNDGEERAELVDAVVGFVRRALQTPVGAAS